MPASRRSTLLAGAGVVLVAVFAALPSPTLTLRRSPSVADRKPGDVRRVAMAVEPSGIVHAALEVWTDSDWDVEYWSSIPKLTPKARIVTVDDPKAQIEQRHTTIAASADRLAMAWIESARDEPEQRLVVTTKKFREYNWPKPVVVATGTGLATPSLAVGAGGDIAVVYTEASSLRIAAVAGGRATHAPDPGIDGVSQPVVAVGRSSSAIAYRKDGAIWLRESRMDGSQPRRIAATGERPALRETKDGWDVAYAVRKADRARFAGAATGSGDFLASRGVALAAAGDGFFGAGLRDDTSLRTAGSDVGVPLGTCCPSVAGFGDHAWTAWLEPVATNAILRVAKIEHLGPAAPFTEGGTIPVTALANEP